ncbi:MAG TPA: TetR/AcrR family transcriptional regulator [Actinokineospora sp.]|nr:TetR/AcrR family transcriptional regulator [Actinokineospora sp.]
MQVTVTEAARRTQIVAAAIEVIAELGYAKTSYARIVEHAGLSSTRLISYHFRDKDDLMMAVLVTALGSADEVLEARIADETDRVGLLRAYIGTRVDLLRTHPRELRAIAEVAEHQRGFAPVLRDFRVGRLERQLRQGQREGVFGEFDPAVMAAAISSAVDGADRSGIDLAEYGAGLTDLFIRACT